MYNIQFQSSSYSDHQHQQYDMSNNNTSGSGVNNDKASFPSPITTTSILDSPPAKNHPYMSLPPHSPKLYNNNNNNNNDNRMHQYDMTSYVPPHPTISIPPPNRDNSSSQYYTSSSMPEGNHLSDALVSPTSPNSGDDETVQRTMQHIFEKKRRRRESHNAVERRRRDNINDRITELATLLPDRDTIKSNKGSILKKTVDHIRFLHDQLRQHIQRIQELENMLEVYRVKEEGIVVGNNNNNNNNNNNMIGMVPAGHPLDLSGSGSGGIQQQQPPHHHHHPMTVQQQVAIQHYQQQQQRDG